MLSCRVSRRPTDLLCLSSGLTVRYRQDILRAIALPHRSHVQFRYSADIVEDGLASDLQNNAICGAIAMLAHVDCSDSSKVENGLCFVTPCRRAVLVSSRRIGDYFVLVFQLWGYAVAADVSVLQQGLPSARPHWSGGGLKGRWCLRSTHRGWEQHSGLEGFQQVARLLSTRPDFAGQPFFLAVEGIFARALAIEGILARGSDGAIEPTADGEVVLAAGKHFDLRLFHFRPDAEHSTATETTGSIAITLASPLEPVTSTSLAVDSPYDLKSFAFRTLDRVTTAQSAAVVLRVENQGASGANSDPSQPELYLPVRVDPSIAKAVGQVAVLTLLLFVQQFVTASSKGAVSANVAVTLFVLALLTAAFAVFALKRPL